MKKTLLYITLLVVVLVLGSCTRNHGDIGIWFGTWQVESITAGGTPVTIGGDYFFQFQSHVFRVSLVRDHEQVVESFGTWEENEDGHTMTVSFPDPDTYYIQMPGLETDNHFTVTDATSRHATFTKTDTTGTSYTYHLKKR